MLYNNVRSLSPGFILQQDPPSHKIDGGLTDKPQTGGVFIPEEGWFGQPKYSTFLKKSHSTLYRSLL